MKNLICIVIGLILIMAVGCNAPASVASEKKNNQGCKCCKSPEGCAKAKGVCVMKKMVNNQDEIDESEIFIPFEDMEDEDDVIYFEKEFNGGKCGCGGMCKRAPKMDKGKFWLNIKEPALCKAFNFTQDDSGKVSLTITRKNKEGEEKTETYQADSLKEFMKKYPEIARQDFFMGFKNPGFMPPGFAPAELRNCKECPKCMPRQDERFNKEMPPPPREMPTPPKPGRLGMMVSPVEPALREHLKLVEGSGIFVQKVMKDSLAEKIGFKKGDVIIKINGNDVDGIEEFKEMMDVVLEKDEVQISIIRKGKEEELKYKK